MTAPGPYRVNIRRPAERDMDRLPAQAFRCIVDAILNLEAEPRPRKGQRLRGAQGQYRIRVGDYRILYLIDDSTRSVTVVAVGHRRDVYRGL